MKRFEPKRILAPVDFSHFSIEALKAALDISEIRGATITALHVSEEPSFPLGSVAERVIRHVPCPVFVIRGNSKS